MNLSFRQALDLEGERLVDVKNSTADLRVFATYIGPTKLDFSMLAPSREGISDPRILERERILFEKWRKSDYGYYRYTQKYLEF